MGEHARRRQRQQDTVLTFGCPGVPAASANNIPTSALQHSRNDLHRREEHLPRRCCDPPHKHGGAAVIGNVVQGHVLNQMVCDGEIHGLIIHSAGDSWYEPPGCHHVRCENGGDEEAIFVANFVIETTKIEELGIAAALVQIDAEKRRKGR